MIRNNVQFNKISKLKFLVDQTKSFFNPRFSWQKRKNSRDKYIQEELANFKVKWKNMQIKMKIARMKIKMKYNNEKNKLM